jgi:UDP-N-acetylglucosamine 2-epimerase (hydrolysing)
VARRRRILFVTGTRAEFGKLRPLISAVEHSDAFDADIFATGMHLLARYGFTLREIQSYGFRSVFPFVNQEGLSASRMDLTLANTVHGLGLYVREFPPDLLVIHGDRVEALAGAIVGVLNNLRVAHIEGGELSGTVDEHIRHAITKLVHLHYVANEEARQRLVQMGEVEESVFIIGSPDIDVMLSGELPHLDEVRRHYAIPFDRYGILLYHPVTTELERQRQHAEAVVEALERSGLNVVIVLPNNDAGSDEIRGAYQRVEHQPWCRLLPSMRFEYFLTLLKHALVIVGNSSAGIREAPVFGVPTVNIGSRQRNRYRYDSIVNVHEEPGAILEALRRLPTRVEPSFYFGTGNSAELFLQTLREETVWSLPCQKQFRDLWPQWPENNVGQ